MCPSSQNRFATRLFPQTATVRVGRVLAVEPPSSSRFSPVSRPGLACAPSLWASLVGAVVVGGECQTDEAAERAEERQVLVRLESPRYPPRALAL
jgi:hypothetical protein